MTPPANPVSCDVAIIGAGIVGCAIARQLTLDGLRVVVLEKALDVLDGASKGNSAILHTGFDAPPGSLEQRCMAAGYRDYFDVAAELGLPILRSGAMVLAWTEEQLAALPDLIAKAHDNGVTDVTPLTRKQIVSREPNLSDAVLGGFEIPGEYLIDPWATAHAYLLQALSNGARLMRGTEVLSGRFDQSWLLETSQGEIKAGHVVNCAGLYGDIVDQRLLGHKSFAIRPRKGQFIVFDKAASDLVSATILPVPTETTKGVVICRTIFGNVLVGPTAEEQDSRTDAATDRQTLLALKSKGVAMLPGLERCEITAAYAGLRPASEHKDYQIRHHDKQACVTVGAIRSTGLSAALGIARHVATLLGIASRPLDAPRTIRADRLSDYHRRDWQEPDHGGIVCHCELVTRREIEQVLDGPMPPATLQGLKRRTRVTMGRCQGFYCTAELAEITEERLQRTIGCDHER
ncbi:NAD(P)/FAD-dependent oxidoreductase [Pseudohoeflea coraliihabitans]|uniref:NAD(P)/FAD-dependent oxidoreductase n=1 Tax=Pseudohoeflea coraliihabitans TaxID=2860393 RepID=A0ABS6WQU7_9HYPH|nr:NAD(P)/FAD-dependent oxidoreductase [Pseudohoeflea sp. DP4N28-3]MBW3098321.1 NAD(P)/FAD-dependent oxidoreductase [Pseudohoeflea sp. DP4N28-3]